MINLVQDIGLAKTGNNRRKLCHTEQELTELKKEDQLKRKKRKKIKRKNNGN